MSIEERDSAYWHNPKFLGGTQLHLNNGEPNFSNLIGNEILHISDSCSVHHQELFTVHSAMVCHTFEQEQDGVPSWSCSQAVCKKWMTYIIAKFTPDDGQRNCPKCVEFHFQNKFEKLVHLVGFIIRKFVTMHGHMNVKNNRKRQETEIFPEYRGAFYLLWRKVLTYNHAPKDNTINSLPNAPNYVDFCPLSAPQSGRKNLSQIFLSLLNNFTQN
jgi:hypothetical protein